MSKNRTNIFKEKLKKEIIEELSKASKFENKNCEDDEKESLSCYQGILENILNLSDEEIEKLKYSYILNRTHVDFHPVKYKVVDLDTYNKMLSSLSEAFNAGEKKEHDRHVEAEDKAFKNGEKYGREAERNRISHDLTEIIKSIMKNLEKENNTFPINLPINKQFQFDNNLNDKIKEILRDLEKNGNDYLKFLNNKEEKKPHPDSIINQKTAERNTECDPKVNFETKDTKDYSSYNENDFKNRKSDVDKAFIDFLKTFDFFKDINWEKF